MCDRIRRSCFCAILGILLTFTGCGSNDTVEIGAWKDNLYSSEATDYGEKLDETISSVADEGKSLSEYALNSFDAALGKISEANTETLNKLGELAEKGKYTVEENGLIKVKLLRVVDGDTLLVDYKEEEYIRLIGINTPESVHPDDSRNTEEGTTASNYTKELLDGTDYVWLEFDADQYDDYDRMLAYVWLSSDTSNTDYMLNVQLLRNGTAELMVIEPNTKYLDVLKSSVN